MTILIDKKNQVTEKIQPKGFLRYFSFSLDHKVIGIQYFVCGFLLNIVGCGQHSLNLSYLQFGRRLSSASCRLSRVWCQWHSIPMPGQV